MSDWQPIETAPRDGTEILASDGELTETTIYSCRSWVYGCCGLNWNPTRWIPIPQHLEKVNKSP